MDADVADAMGTWQHAVKRALDFVFALVGLVVLSPLMLVIYIILKAQRNGPAIEEDKDGNRFEGSYLDDVRDGRFVEKDRDGNITAQGVYIRGQKRLD